MISIHWCESHDAILNDEMKQLSWTDVEGQRTVIVGRKWGVSMRFTSSLQQKKEPMHACNLYEILALNDKGVTKGL